LEKPVRKLPLSLTIACAMACFLIADVAVAQPDRGGEFRQTRMAMMGGGMGLLTDERVQQELELMDDQLEELRAIQEEAQSAMRDMFAEMGDANPEDRRQQMEGMREKIQERMSQYQEKVDAVLLPHQRDRLKQLTYQSEGRYRGAGGALNNDRLLEELGVTGEQREKLNAALEKARQELQEKYAKMVRDAEEEVLDVLTAEQREQYRKLVGEPFEFGTPGRPGGERAERGERGGERGGRGDRGNRDRNPEGDGNQDGDGSGI
jgi:Spy/CpxP family protein refolding chaperone